MIELTGWSMETFDMIAGGMFGASTALTIPAYIHIQKNRLRPVSVYFVASAMLFVAATVIRAEIRDSKRAEMQQALTPS